jgi:hypothetical protein
MKKLDYRRTLLAIAVAVATSTAVLFATGCGKDSPTAPAGPDSPSDDGPGDGPGDPTSPFECAKKGYPCSLSAVPIEVLERSDALGDSVVDMLVAGSSAAEAVARLQAEDGMAEVQSDDGAIRFRLGGGRAMWIMLEGDELDGDAGGASPVLPPPGVPRPYRNVVGEDSEQKHALVLSPFLWSLGGYDDGPAVDAILQGTRGYEGRVEFLANHSATDTTVGVGAFTGWGQYQVVHVTSHGRRLCEEAGCRAMIVVNTLEALAHGGSQTPAELTKTLEQQGLDVTKSTHHPGTTFVAATAAFFQATYPSGLDNTVVFLNACQTFGWLATDLVEAIHGNSSVVLGWDEAVHADEAKAAAVALFQHLSDGGYTAEVAYDRLGDLKNGTATEYGGPPRLVLGLRPKGGDLRIRDIVTLLDPVTEQELTAQSVVLIDGTKGDGEADGAPWLVRVDGMRQEDAAKAILHVTIDGVAADPVAVSDGTPNDKDQWTLSGAVALGYDLTEERTVEFRAWVELPDEGKSEQRVSAELSGDEALMGREWEFTATHTTSWTGISNTPYTATADLTLTLAPGQAPGERHPSYIITGGTVTWNWTHSYGDCTYTTPTVTFEVTQEIANQSVLIFDTTTDPVTYRGFMSTVGPDVESVEQCAGGDAHTRLQGATNTWMFLQPGEDQPVSADRRSISGTYRSEVDFINMSFIQESKYTITRIH